MNRLVLENFKAFRSLDLPLGHLTLLSGLNSAGKSSILQAIALMRQSNDARMLGASDGQRWLLNGPLSQLGTARDVFFEAGESPSISVQLGEGFEPFQVSINDLDADVLYGQPSESPESLPVLCGPFNYLRADRISPDLIYPRSYQEVVERSSLGSRGEYTVHFLQHFQDHRVQNTALVEPEAGSSLLSQVMHWMGLIAPGVRIEPSYIKGTDFVQVRFGFGASAGLAGSEAYRPTHVGFGLTYTLPIIVALLGTPPGGTLLLENPEAHVHPRGQAALGAMMARGARGGLRIIVETHSDHVLNGVRLACKDGVIAPDDVWVHFFRRISAHDVVVESPIIDRTGRLSRWPNGFFDQWDRDLDRLFE